MLRGRDACASSILSASSPTRSLPCRFPYRFRPSLNCPVFWRFPTRTDSRTEPSSLYPLSSLSLPHPYRKTGGGGRGAPSFSPLATRHSPLRVSPTIPAPTVRSPVTLIIPALTQNRGRGATTMAQPSSNTLDLSTHSVNVGAPTFLAPTQGTPAGMPALGALTSRTRSTDPGLPEKVALNCKLLTVDWELTPPSRRPQQPSTRRHFLALLKRPPREGAATEDLLKKGVLPKRYRIFLPRPERASSTASRAVRLCSSIMGLISTISMETMDSLSAIISMAKCASR